jgi:hypothetical protein
MLEREHWLCGSSVPLGRSEYQAEGSVKDLQGEAVTWALLITLKFMLVAHSEPLELPAPTHYDNYDECVAVGKELVEFLTQDGLSVEGVCVIVPDEEI